MWVFQVLIRRLASHFCSYKMFDCFFNILKLWHTFLMVLWSCCVDQHSPRDCKDSETSSFVLAYLACHCEWKVSWGGWGGPVATFISHCPGLLNNFPLLCAISAPLRLLAAPVDDLCYTILVHRLGSPRREARLVRGKQHKSSDRWCGKVLPCMVITWNHSLESINLFV